ncbi:related to acetylxylan esterase [Phialocephala subalpina]|uniref:Related to acetylxylan esterase n=1 Tax=Phialocephala subalpina TaxID=576137 RepID=A0A1L7XU06_9HELO|nr:related to acetylxylan esterase [Phialocephala subalpina]
MSNNLPRADPPISGSPPLSQRVPRSNNTPLRIMPLGNSITWGYLSTSGNGYRQPLLSLLSANHTKIQYIGSQRSGNMTNNQNEGHPGATISQIASYANLSLPQQPNLILMMAGTNDMAQDNQTATAPQRLGALIDECHNGVSKENGGTVILVAQLTPAADNGTESRIQAFNAQVPGVVDERAKKGMKVLTVDMSQYVTVGDLKDGLHPSDEGYAKMAKAWYDGIGEAIGRGWIEAPVLILGP